MKRYAVYTCVSFLIIALINLNTAVLSVPEDNTTQAQDEAERNSMNLNPVQVELPDILKKDHPTFSNLLKNGSFETVDSNIPYAWDISNAPAMLWPSDKKIGDYSLYLMVITAGTVSQEIQDIQALKGEKIAFGAWVKTAITEEVKLIINDGVSQYESDPHSGSNEWEFLTLKAILDENAAQITVSINVNAIGAVYIDGATLYQLTKDFVFTENPDDDIKMPNNLIYTDLINKQVGINTNTPQEALEVEGNIKATGIILQGENETLTQTSADSLYVNQTGDTMTGSLTLESANLNVNGNITADKFLLSDGTEVKSGLWTTKEGTSDIYYDSGNVGIGRTEPKAKLHILDGNDTIKLGDIFGWSAPIIQLIDTDDNNSVEIGGTDGDLKFRTGNSDRMTIRYDGSVGIGTTEPGVLFNVKDQFRVVDGAYTEVKPGSSEYGLIIRDQDSNDWGNIDANDGYLSIGYNNDNGPLFITDGSVGIGTTGPGAKIDIANIGSDVTGLKVVSGNSAGANVVYFSGNPSAGYDFVMKQNGNVGIGTTDPQGYKLYVAGDAYVSSNLTLPTTRTLTTGVLTITGGSDIAEPFKISGAKDLPLGALVVIDEQNPGQLKLSRQAYDQRVAGIISGAGKIKPGLTLSQEGLIEGGQNVAIGGRVYALATNLNGAIKPGDLLTTSNRSGYAMKATDRNHSHGAVIGKAMTSLDEDEGLVLVLVNLQ